MDVIISHINADFDAFASMVGAQKLYPEARIVFPGSQEKKLRDFLTIFHPLSVARIRDIPLPEIKRVIIVDAKTADRIGPFADVVLRSENTPEVHLYDHHPRTGDDLRSAHSVIEQVGSTATIFTEILKSKKIPLTPMEATILCLGIYEETGSLLFPSTTERDLLAVAYLVKRGASLKIVSNFIRTELSKEELDLLNELMKSGSDIEMGGTRVRIVKAAREEELGDAAHFAHRIMEIEDIDGLVLLLGMQGKILMVGRSRVSEFNVAELLQAFGGGGHTSAASATVKDMPLEMVEEEVKRRIPVLIRHSKTALDVMTSPVITIEWGSSVGEAASIMTRYGVNVLPVVQDGEYRGIISREIVEKATFHGFGKSRVSDFTTTDALTAIPEMPVREIERLMIEQNQRFMPVVEDKKIIGAITRTDILRSLYEEMLRSSRLPGTSAEKPSVGRNLSNWLRERFPRIIVETLGISGEIADQMGYNAYLVGGSVRDLLRGQENLDIDIVVEGDGILFSRNLAQRLNVKMRSHERFGTAQLFLGSLKIDVATARTEYYESPASLPKVETSSIKKDLYRRDFTINTLAVKLNTKDFGLLIDFFGGQRDLREKTIRVLHNLSFIEDPTRAFRAVRFSERFNFKLSRHTENLIRSALRMNLFDRLSGSRLYEELLLTFAETEPVKAVKRLSEYGLLKVIHPELVFDEKLEERFQAIHDTLSWFNLLFLEEKAERGSLYLMTLLSFLGDSERDAALDRLTTPKKMKDTLQKDIAQAREVIRVLPLHDPVKIFLTLRSLSVEGMLFAMAVAPDDRRKKEISHYLLTLRQVKPQIKGKDLEKLGLAPGPVYSEIMSRVLEEKLKGNLPGRNDEIAFVREKYRGASGS